MKTSFAILAVCLIYSSHIEAAINGQTVAIPNQISQGTYSVPTGVLTSPECAPILQQLSQLQMQYLEEHQYLLKQELAKNQQHHATLTQISQISKQGRSGLKPVEIETIQSDSGVTETPKSEGIIPSIITKTSNVAGDIANTAGQLAKDDIELKAALLTGILGGAGHAAGSALHETGQVAAHAVSNIEDGFKNIFGNFGK